MPTLLICLLEKCIAAAGVSSYVMGGARGLPRPDTGTCRRGFVQFPCVSPATKLSFLFNVNLNYMR